MINDKEALFQRINIYKFCNPNSILINEKLNAFESAIDSSIKKICEESLMQSSKIHLAYSGGVDSSIILMKILKFGFPLTAHTIASTETYPDMVHSNKFIENLKEQMNIEHVKHIIIPSKQDLEESNKLLNLQSSRPDNYYMLMQNLVPYTKEVICCDCIDELMGGYYSHQNPKNLPIYNEKESELNNKFKALVYHMSRLIPDHLSILDKSSSHFKIIVRLPYGDPLVMKNAGMFNLDELIDESQRKKPIYEIAKKNDIPKHILERKKYGFCSALDLVN